MAEPPARPPQLLPRSALAGDPLTVAPALLNKLLVTADGRMGRIIEVEAYRGAEDAGSHAYRGRTPRTAVMFGGPGPLYVYFTYGMHWCANVVCGPEGQPGAVLLRALEPVTGLPAMRAARLAARRGTPDRPVPDGQLCRGPAVLCQALGVTGADGGVDLVAARGMSGAGRLWLGDDGTPPPTHPAVGPRIGLRAGAELPWRFWLPGHAGVSGPRQRETSRPTGVNTVDTCTVPLARTSTPPAAGDNFG